MLLNFPMHLPLGGQAEPSSEYLGEPLRLHFYKGNGRSNRLHKTDHVKAGAIGRSDPAIKGRRLIVLYRETSFPRKEKVVLYLVA